MHEYLLVWKKAPKSLFAIGYETAMDIQQKIASTWRSVIRLALMKLGGQATLSRIYDEVSKVAGDLMAQNKNWQAKVRQKLQIHYTSVERGVWAL
jgi:DNA-binding ferritin-like protein (Dps family)